MNPQHKWPFLQEGLDAYRQRIWVCLGPIVISKYHYNYKHGIQNNDQFTQLDLSAPQFAPLYIHLHEISSRRGAYQFYIGCLDFLRSEPTIRLKYKSFMKSLFKDTCQYANLGAADILCNPYTHPIADFMPAY